MQRLPKQVNSSTAKVRQICQEYADEFSAIPDCDLRCNLCDVVVKCDKKFYVESHQKSKQYQGKLATKSKSEERQKTQNSINTEGGKCKVKEGIEPPRRVSTLLKGLIRR